jgi:hypothetical protein
MDPVRARPSCLGSNAWTIVVFATCCAALVLLSRIRAILAQRRFARDNQCRPVRDRCRPREPFLGLDILVGYVAAFR